MSRDSRASTQNRALAFVFAQTSKGGIYLTQHPTISRNAPNRGPNPGRWLFAGFTAASLSPLLCRPASAATIWTTEAMNRLEEHLNQAAHDEEG